MKYKAAAIRIETFEQFEQVLNWIKDNCQFSVYIHSLKFANDADLTISCRWIKVEECVERGISMFDQHFRFGSRRDWMLFKMRWS